MRSAPAAATAACIVALALLGLAPGAPVESLAIRVD